MDGRVPVLTVHVNIMPFAVWNGWLGLICCKVCTVCCCAKFAGMHRCFVDGAGLQAIDGFQLLHALGLASH